MNHRLPYRMKPAFATLLRACIAVVTAYALALQVLLLSITAASAAMAPQQADALVICYGSGNKADDSNPLPPHSPANLADCTLSCAQGLSAAAILPSGISTAPVFGIATPLEQKRTAAFILPAHPSPRLSQGPPRIA